MRKRTYTKPVAGLLSLSALALGMLATTQSAEAQQNVANTKHNLSNQRSGLGVNGGTGFGASGVGDIYTVGASASLGDGTAASAATGGGSDQICVFCHTPHGANTGVTSVPLWNRSVRSSGAYTAYTMIGSNSTGTASVGGMSLACLSCHDGTQAMDAMFNAPGSGPGLTDTSSITAGQEYTWTAGAATDLGGAVYFTPTTNGALNAPITLLGTDLSNDHPIGMYYCGGISTAGGGCGDTDFKTGTGLAGNNKSKIGVLKLFGNTGNALTSTVECATCHDPHLERGGTPLDGDTVNKVQLFLRVSPVASRICLTCHTK